jgi:3-hydroxymyristoyl/3-hydroxydecanoyl-(acyl carrier protein) dehydratase
VRFLLVDRILEVERGRRALGLKNVSMTEDYLTHNFPDTPIMPGALIAESAIQLANWVIREATDFRRSGLAAAVDRARFYEMVRPGDQLKVEVELLAQDDGGARFSAIVTCGERRVASGRFKLTFVDTESLEARDDARRLFTVLYQPGSAKP